jgi:hypothetical protein
MTKPALSILSRHERQHLGHRLLEGLLLFTGRSSENQLKQGVEGGKKAERQRDKNVTSRLEGEQRWRINFG